LGTIAGGWVKKLKDFLRVKEAAEFLGVSPNTLRNWSQDGKIPVLRNPINDYRLYRKSDLERLLQRIDRQDRPVGSRGER
jgi:MerR family copper efflux transcriptional regulator